MSRQTRERVFERDGYVCVDCGTPYALTVQHRAGRGMGGSKHLDRMSNLLTMCNVHNCLLEESAKYAETGRELGWKLHRNRLVSPADVPVFHRPLRAWFYLEDDGSRMQVEAPDEAA
ncbi:HNH endonuclease [Kocuria sp.]|uniref:HNH endonuclease n=1 Tax=Kocuria sp. TaxID=1871328 RepID=UPI0026DC7039|nr:hypothetical protein [Kocuria sp.]MDO4919906.1 hypothetical protein [Kocuria sp.]